MHATGPIFAKGIDAITEVPESHWRVADYLDERPQGRRPDLRPPRRFSHAGRFSAARLRDRTNSVEATDTTQLLGLMVARQALADAGCLESEPLDRDKVSVILGVTGTLELVIPLGARLGHPIWRRALEAAGVDQATTEDVVRRIADSYVGWQENSFPGLLGNVAAGRIANRLDLRGTNCVVDAACAARWAPSTWPCSSSPPAAATSPSPAASIRLMTFLCICALARPRRFADRRCAAV